jgi:hypothetical protein
VGWLLLGVAAYLVAGGAMLLIEMAAEDGSEPGDIVESLLIWPILLAIKVRRRLAGRSQE